MKKYYVYGIVENLLKRAQRALKGYTVTLPGEDAMLLFKILTPRNEYGYTDIFPGMDYNRPLNKNRLYCIYIEENHVYIYRNPKFEGIELK